MSKTATWSQAELDNYQAKQARQRGDPEFDNEAEFQTWAEAQLVQGGFERRTPANIAKCHGKLWYIHLNKTKQNPIIGDLLLIDSRCGPQDVRAIEIELKTLEGKLTTEQGYLYKRAEIILCRTKAEFMSAVYKWINNKGEKE